MDLPTIDLTPMLRGENDQAGNRAMVEALHKYGAALVLDPRVSVGVNETYLDMMERYFGQSEGIIAQDERPLVFHQVGVSPRCLEQPRDFRSIAARMLPIDRPTILPLDYAGEPKRRFFWPLGSRPVSTDFPVLNQTGELVVPAAFTGEWANTMNNWGNMMLQAVATVLSMVELGTGLKPGFFVQLMNNAPHLLAPNGVKLEEQGQLGTVYNAFHTDLNLLTIHGPSRFPALRIWLRDNRVVTVKVPKGYLLVQVGEQLEWLSGGYFLAGYHEVVCLPETLQAMRVAHAEGRPSIRSSSTVFAHSASDQWLEVAQAFLRLLGQGWAQAAPILYPRVRVGDQVTAALKALGIAV